MPRIPGKIRSIQARNDAANKKVATAVDAKIRPKPKPVDPNAWKKQHVTNNGVPITRVARYDAPQIPKRKRKP